MSESSRFEKKPKNSIAADRLTLKERLSALANLPGFFKLVWQTSPGLTIASAVLRLIRSAIPLAMLHVGKLIIDEVVLLSNSPATSADRLWELVVVEFALAIAADGLSRAVTLIDSLLGDLFFKSYVNKDH